MGRTYYKVIEIDDSAFKNIDKSLGKIKKINIDDCFKCDDDILI